MLFFIFSDQNKPPEALESKDVQKKESMNFWTAHKTEAGIFYYYNSLTGVSTYEKPEGFKAEVLIPYDYNCSHLSFFITVF